MTPAAIICKALGGCYAVRFDPPFSPAETFADFSEATGYATATAAKLGLRLIDETGRLSGVECAALLLGMSIDDAAGRPALRVIEGGRTEGPAEF